MIWTFFSDISAIYSANFSGFLCFVSSAKLTVKINCVFECGKKQMTRFFLQLWIVKFNIQKKIQFDQTGLASHLTQSNDHQWGRRRSESSQNVLQIQWAGKNSAKQRSTAHIKFFLMDKIQMNWKMKIHHWIVHKKNKHQHHPHIN